MLSKRTFIIAALLALAEADPSFLTVPLGFVFISVSACAVFIFSFPVLIAASLPATFVIVPLLVLTFMELLTPRAVSYSYFSGLVIVTLPLPSTPPCRICSTRTSPSR